MKKNIRNYVVKIQNDGRTIQSIRTHSKKAFLTHLRRINWRKDHVRGYLRVSYGKCMDNHGISQTFFNDGWYTTEKDFWLAFRAFDEG